MTSVEPMYPRPAPDSDSTPYWEGLRDGKVLYQRCLQCGERQLYFRAVCRACWSDELAVEESAGHGVVYSFTVLHAVGDRALAAEGPLTIAVVDLDEGPRVMTRIEGDTRDIRIGERVSASFRCIDDSVTLLHFVRASARPA
jgi:uncharacterized OB-fold protein